MLVSGDGLRLDALRHDLSRRYEADYQVCVGSSAAAALTMLAVLAGARAAFPDRDARPGRLRRVVLLRCQRGDELGPGVDVELAVDLAQVELDRLGRQEQAGRDVTV